ncbi:response regulator [Nitrobacter sp. JJSN]|uniref:response regulator n=1 Tax=Nitrobacter sp. JJSN TaxID=3453033 RepID=UPI003F775CBD
MTDRRTKRILIVEDEFLVALHLEDVLTGMGHQIVGPCTRIEVAMAVARESSIDFALLDINVAGTPSFAVADILRQRSIPFVFASGYGLEGLVDGYRNETALRKPYDLEELKVAIARIFPELSH